MAKAVGQAFIPDNRDILRPGGRQSFHLPLAQVKNAGVPSSPRLRIDLR